MTDTTKEEEHLARMQKRREAVRRKQQIQAVVLLLILPVMFYFISLFEQGVGGGEDPVAEEEAIVQSEKGKNPNSGGSASAQHAGGQGGKGGLDMDSLAGLHKPQSQIEAMAKGAGHLSKSGGYRSSSSGRSEQNSNSSNSALYVGSDITDVSLGQTDWQLDDASSGQPVVVGNPRVESGVIGGRRLRAQVINRSDSSLSFAEVEIRFLGQDGAVLLTRLVNPLVISGGMFGDRSKPLAPGQVRTFGMSLSDVPPGWSGAVTFRLNRYQLGNEMWTPADVGDTPEKEAG
ncbi:MAG: hypothetical protein HQL54_14630 [Magnetococcales bacterium]|nr:hypothetical protein [Magnetococcales bacterium]